MEEYIIQRQYNIYIFRFGGTFNSLIGNSVDLIDDYDCRRKQDWVFRNRNEIE